MMPPKSLPRIEADVCGSAYGAMAEALVDYLRTWPHTPDTDHGAPMEAVVDALMAQIDAALSAQLNAILHHPTVQKLEAAWRGLLALVSRVNFSQNIKLEMVHVTRDELIADFEDKPELPKSGLYRLVYSSEYGVFGGEPFGAVIGNYSFGPSSQDMMLLSQIAAISAMAHAPFITNACPRFFGDTSFESLVKLVDIHAMLDGPQMVKWHKFRDSEHSRYVGLCLPRFLLRMPYCQSDVSVRAFNFHEDVEGMPEHYLWGHASIALATRIADSFARYRWCPHIVGPVSGGALSDLMAPPFQAAPVIQKKIPTEVRIAERLEYALSQEGFIALSWRKASDHACFFSANSTQKPRSFLKTPTSNAAEVDFRLGTQLPYLFIMTRLAHYVKVMQREAIGRYQGRAQLQHDINLWLSHYVADMQDPALNVRARRPLRRAAVYIEDVAGQSEWYRWRLEVQPHLKYMGAGFTLSLVGRLDKI